MVYESHLPSSYVPPQIWAKAQQHSVRPHVSTLTSRLTIFVALIGEDSRDVSTLRWTFVAATARGNPELVDLSSLLDEAVLQLRKDVPLQLVVDMFRKMV